MTARPLLTLVVSFLLVIPAVAQVPDHLECYKVKDRLKLAGVVDLDSPEFGLVAGCKVSRAKLFCTPATKTGGSATDKGTGASITPLPISGAPTPDDRICYKMKCPDPALAILRQDATDQFGTRTLTKFKASMLCAPAVRGTAFCGDGTIDAGEDCEGSNLGGATCQSLGFENGTLACGPGCKLDASACGCSACPAPTCGNGSVDDAEQCDGSNLDGSSCAALGYSGGGVLDCSAGCAFDTSGCQCQVTSNQTFPASGQTIAYTADKNDGLPFLVGIPDDATTRAGGTLAAVDNGDGTITDSNTRLMWEKKSDDGGLHDWENAYLWSGVGNQETIWDWMDDVNAEGGSGFAGHDDWRIPNVKELQSIADYGRLNPAIIPVFQSACTSPCSVVTCSCTNASMRYWSSTTFSDDPTRAWGVTFFEGGLTEGADKANSFAVRAVRGGT